MSISRLHLQNVIYLVNNNQINHFNQSNVHVTVAWIGFILKIHLHFFIHV